MTTPTIEHEVAPSRHLRLDDGYVTVEAAPWEIMTVGIGFDA